MIRIFFTLMLLFGFLKADDPYKNLDHYTLKNGMQIYLLPDEKAKNVFITAEVNVGMKAETKETAGLSHLVEHIVFRDQRVEGKDYYNIIKEKGATDVNGYTSYYKTEYVTTINPENAYWITKTFYKMLFDKNVTDEDLKIEKGALQLEIGEPSWIDYVIPDIGKFFRNSRFLKKIFPPSDNVYERDFGIDFDKEKREYQSSLTYKLNNKKFTLKEVLDHYHDYYYPSNMKLKIVGKFDKDKMKDLIAKTFATVPKRDGKSVKEPLFKDAKLDNKPYIRYRGGMDDNARVMIGEKLIQDDPKKMIVLKAYMESLADRLLKEFRNKKGQAYGVSGYVQEVRNAAIATLSFNAPHDVFDKHIKTAQSWLKKESSGDINDTTIAEALKQRRNRYDAVEHDVDSLMSSIDNYIYYKRFFPAQTKTPYQLLDSITPEYFRQVLKDTFTPKHRYMVVYRDYILFPYEGAVLMFLLFIVSIYFFIRFISARVPKRKVILKRRLTNWFGIFLIAVLIGIVSELVDEWVEYLLSVINPELYDIPLSYLFFILEAIIDIVITYFVLKLFFRWFYLTLFVTDDQLILSGVNERYIDLDRIKKLEVVPYFPRPWGKIYGNSFLFWRKLLKITLDDGEELYIRSFNANHLKEDIEKFLSKA